MHGEVADKPRYSFNFRVGLEKKKRERERKRRGGRGKNGKGGLIKRANVAARWEVEAGEEDLFKALDNERRMWQKIGFVNMFSSNPAKKTRGWGGASSYFQLALKFGSQRCSLMVFRCSFCSLNAFMQPPLPHHFDLCNSIVTGDALQSLYRGDINI